MQTPSGKMLNNGMKAILACSLMHNKLSYHVSINGLWIHLFNLRNWSVPRIPNEQLNYKTRIIQKDRQTEEYLSIHWKDENERERRRKWEKDLPWYLQATDLTQILSVSVC